MQKHFEIHELFFIICCLYNFFEDRLYAQVSKYMCLFFALFWFFFEIEAEKVPICPVTCPVPSVAGLESGGGPSILVSHMEAGPHYESRPLVLCKGSTGRELEPGAGAGAGAGLQPRQSQLGHKCLSQHLTSYVNLVINLSFPFSTNVLKFSCLNSSTIE